MTTKQKTVTVNGLEVSYLDRGNSSRVLLMIHGFSFTLGFKPILDKADKNIRIICPALPGFGETFPSPNYQSLDQYVDFLYEFITTLKLKKVAVFGNSMGGTLALLLAHKHPHSVDKLIIRSPLIDCHQLPFLYRNKSCLAFYKLLAKNKYATTQLKSLFLREYSKQSIDVKATNVLETIKSIQLQKLDTDTTKSILFELAETNISKKLKEIKTPTLLLWGGKDNLLRSEWAEKICSLLPHSSLYIDNQEHHNLTTVDLRALNKRISLFVLGKSNIHKYYA